MAKMEKKSAYDFKSIEEAAEKAGKAMKAAMLNGGACLVITANKVPEGLSFEYFSFCNMGVPDINLTVNNHFYQKLAQEAEERMRAEITVTGTLN